MQNTNRLTHPDIVHAEATGYPRRLNGTRPGPYRRVILSDEDSFFPTPEQMEKFRQEKEAK